MKVVSAHYTWTCNVCGEVIRAEVPTEVIDLTEGRKTVLMTKHFPDAYAHRWTHEDETSGEAMS